MTAQQGVHGHLCIVGLEIHLWFHLHLEMQLHVLVVFPRTVRYCVFD